MTTLYCSECGYKNEYTIHPPNFCGGCGAKLKDSIPDSRKKNKRGGRASANKDYDPDETDVDSVPNIGKLEVDVSYEGQARVFKGEDMANVPEENLRGRNRGSN